MDGREGSRRHDPLDRGDSRVGPDRGECPTFLGTASGYAGTLVLSGPPARILVVDDDALLLAQVVDALSPAKFTVVTASSASKGLTVLATQRSFDLILCDLQMPEMDGFEFRRQLRANPKTAEIPFCFVTASVRDEDKATARQLGARAFLRKPVNPARLLAFVRETLTEAGLADQRRLVALAFGRRLRALGIAFEITPDGTRVHAVVPFSQGRFSNAFTRAPIPSVTLENIDDERLRAISPAHLSTLPPIPLTGVAGTAALERAVVDAYHLHARARRREKILLERWGIVTEYDDDASRFLGRVKVGRDELTFTALDERTILLLASTGRLLGGRSREVDVSGATSSVEIAFTLEEILRSLPAAPPVVAKPRPPDLALGDIAEVPVEEMPPPLVAGYVAPEPALANLEPDALIEPVLVLEPDLEAPRDAAPAGVAALLCAVCVECGRRFYVPDEVADERQLTTCDRCF